jgi:hydrogenase expression/formation protein HypE
LNEIAEASGVGIRIFEDRLPINPAVASASEMLGLDPLYIANEGKCLVITPGENAEQVLEAMKGHPLGRDACIIGEVVDEKPGRVVLKTRVGGTRILTTPTGEQLPRIC